MTYLTIVFMIVSEFMRTKMCSLKFMCDFIISMNKQKKIFFINLTFLGIL